jgi:hypothetical protein
MRAAAEVAISRQFGEGLRFIIHRDRLRASFRRPGGLPNRGRKLISIRFHADRRTAGVDKCGENLECGMVGMQLANRSDRIDPWIGDRLI